jgi:hypothetical protein
MIIVPLTIVDYLDIIKSYAITRVHVAYLPILPSPLRVPLPLQPDHLTPCISSVQSTFATWLSLPDSVFARIPTSEWSRFIQLIITLLMLTSANPGKVELTSFGPSFNLLQSRMAGLSRQPSDGFALWKTAIGIIKEKYARLAEEGNIISMTMSSMCPVHSMEFSSTDFWDSMVKGGDFMSDGMSFGLMSMGSEDSRTESSVG